MINQETKLSINPLYRLQWEPAQDCHVLLYPEGMIQLNPPAAEILTRCVPSCTVSKLVADLTQAFPEATTLDDDVSEFVQTAHDKGWLLLDEL